MFRSTFVRSLVTALGAAILVSCADSGLIGPADPSGGLSGTQGGVVVNPGSSTPTELHALWWNENLAAPVTVSKTIGSSGGSIAIPQTGLTVSFPAGAVQSPLTITITADTKYVAYKMEPSGTRFLKDVTATQQLSATQLAGAALQGQIYSAYIADDSVSLSGKVPVLEIEPSTTILSTASQSPQAQVWTIKHFSRYMLASN
jgi:hypothetical protein